MTENTLPDLRHFRGHLRRNPLETRVLTQFSSLTTILKLMRAGARAGAAIREVQNRRKSRKSSKYAGLRRMQPGSTVVSVVSANKDRSPCESTT